jgi:hypothetical protein
VGLEDCLRVSVGTEDEVRRFLAAMEEIMTRRRAAAHFGVAGSATGHTGE